MRGASTASVQKSPTGTLRPMRFIAAANSSRSSAIAIERAFAPISSTP
jgi:hypothetical protein